MPGVIHGCYRGSRLQSVALTASNSIYHNLWRSLHISCVSQHMRGYLLASSFPASRVTVIPNPVGSAGSAVELASGEDVLFASRLEPEKGLEVLLEAWDRLSSVRRTRSVLHIAGSGTQGDLARSAAESRPDIVFHGPLPAAELEKLGRRCKVSVIPSLWAEPFGRTVIEAYRAGRGVVVSDQGALPELVRVGETGWVGCADVEGLRHALALALDSDPIKLRMAAHEYWKSDFTREAVTSQYLRWYSRVLGNQD